MKDDLKEMIIYDDKILGADNEWDAPEVQRIEGKYKDSEFILDRIYDEEYEEDGEIYYRTSRWEYASEGAPRDENNERVDIEVIVEKYDYRDYSNQKR